VDSLAELNDWLKSQWIADWQTRKYPQFTDKTIEDI